MNIIKEKIDNDIYVKFSFAIKENDLVSPFVFIASGCKPGLSPFAQMMGQSNSYGCHNIEEFQLGTWNNWRELLEFIDCKWVISIIEDAISNNETKLAVNKILLKIKDET